MLIHKDLYSLKQHVKCNISRPTLQPFYPSRLVEILTQGEATNLRICLTGDDVPTGPYMTLSHRWGTASFLKLTLSNLADLVKGFSVTDLPRTFQDAISVVKRLGLYANSCCNIAATWNSSSDDGCFTQRSASEVEGLVVSPQWTGLENSICRVVEYGLWENLVTSAGLNMRAWVVQERLLAPRILHFCHNQLAWECHEVDACETYPAGLPIAQQSAQTRYKGIDPNTDGKRLQSMGDSRSAPNLHAYHIWNKIVTAYTAGELTVATDKFVAISGLAGRMQPMLQDEYIAGLWRGTLPSDLLWKVTGGKQANGLPSARATQYRAPSWSWASLDGHILPGRPNIERILISIEEAVTNPLIPTIPLGQLKSGWIRLRGVLLPGMVKIRESSVLQPERLSVHFADENIAGDYWISPDIQNEISDQPVFCLIISTKNQYNGTLLLGLALHCVNRAKATYRRIGLFEGNPKPHSVVQYSKTSRRVELCKDVELETIVLI
ncbi:MAG: hypothetical protein Q9216_001923 [Gyalolechia sp. 2 TL-2023]